MSPTAIKIALLRKGITQTSIAKKLGVTPTSIYLVISGQRKSRQIAQAVSEVVEKPMEKVFPKYSKSKESPPKTKLTI